MHHGSSSDNIDSLEERSYGVESSFHPDHEDFAPGPEHSLLNDDRIKIHQERERRSYKMTSLGKFRAYWLGIVVCMGGYLCMFPP